MAEHEPSIGASDDWYTPAEIFDALGLMFDLDPCSPGPGHWVPARRIYTKTDDGIAIVRAYTSAAWFHTHAIKADCMLFPRGKTKFIRPDGSVGKSPGHGIVLLGMGTTAQRALRRSNLGFLVIPEKFHA